jgi:hypothetical protein
METLERIASNIYFPVVAQFWLFNKIVSATIKKPRKINGENTMKALPKLKPPMLIC